MIYSTMAILALLSLIGGMLLRRPASEGTGSGGKADSGSPAGRKRRLWLGWLTFLLAAEGFIACGLSLSDRFMLTFEIGAVLIEGSGLELVEIRLLLVLLTLTGGLAFSLTCLLVGHEVKRPWLSPVLGLTVGILSNFGIRPVNEEVLDTFRVYAFDLFYPPIFLWCTGCLVAAITVYWARSFWAQIVWIYLFASSLYSCFRPKPFVDPSSQSWWRPLVLILLVTAVVAAGRWLTDKPLSSRNKLRALWVLGKKNFKDSRQREQDNKVITFSILVLTGGAMALYYWLAGQAIWKIDLPMISLTYIVLWLCLIHFVDSQSPLQSLLISGRERAGEIAKRFWSQVGKAFNFESWPATIVKSVMFVLGALILSEIWTAGQTIVEPFRDRREDAPERSGLGESISEQLIHQLILFNEFFSSKAIPIGIRDTFGENATLNQASEVSGGFGAVFSQSHIEFQSLKVPVDAMVKPIQRPLRTALNTEVITGSLECEGQEYRLLAISSAGRSWEVHAPYDAAHSGADLGKVIRDLSEELAFNIYISGARDLQHLGMVTSWETFKKFLDALALMGGAHGEKDRTKAVEQLREITQTDPSFALAHYHIGLDLLADDGIGNARYYDSAIESFSKILEYRPDFVPAHNALADAMLRNALQNLKGSEALSNNLRHQIESRWQQVLLFPHSSALSRAAAYSGLKNLLLGRAREIDRDQGLYGVAETDDHLRMNTLAFFYAMKAEKLYSEVQERSSDPARLLLSHAEVLYQLADILERRKKSPVFVENWSCRGETLLLSLEAKIVEAELGEKAGLGKMLEAEAVTGFLRNADLPLSGKGRFLPSEEQERFWVLDYEHERYTILREGERFSVYGTMADESPYSGAAERFYREALGRNPNDLEALCNLAEIEYVKGNDRPMAKLEGDWRARLRLAEGYESFVGPEATFYIYRRVFDELEAAYQLMKPEEGSLIERYAGHLEVWRLLGEGGTQEEVLEKHELYGLANKLLVAKEELAVLEERATTEPSSTGSSPAETTPELDADFGLMIEE